MGVLHRQGADALRLVHIALRGLLPSSMLTLLFLRSFRASSMHAVRYRAATRRWDRAFSDPGEGTLPKPRRPAAPARSYESELLKRFDRLLVDLRKRIDANSSRLVAADTPATLNPEDVARLDAMAAQANELVQRAAVSAGQCGGASA